MLLDDLIRTWNVFAEMSLATIVPEDCCLCYPSTGIFRSSRPCVGELLNLLAMFPKFEEQYCCLPFC